MKSSCIIVVGIVVGVVVAGCACYLAYRRFARKNERKSSVAPASEVKQTRSLSDQEIVERLSQEHRELFDGGATNIPFTHKGLHDDILCSRLKTDEKRFDQLLAEIIKSAPEVYAASAKVGDEFDYAFMDTDKEMPDDYRIADVITRGLVRIETHEVIVKAFVR